MEHLEAKAKINTSAIESSWTEAKISKKFVTVLTIMEDI